jgi:hypothetical protein
MPAGNSPWRYTQYTHDSAGRANRFSSSAYGGSCRRHGQSIERTSERVSLAGRDEGWVEAILILTRKQQHSTSNSCTGVKEWRLQRVVCK